jgi:energy-coupling factor transporter ATP-binding protein EcfA2
MYQSEIRDSEVRDLLEKVRKHNYLEYLLSLRLDRIRQFEGATVTFDFPVTAIVGPNGSGKSTILGAAGCLYKTVDPRRVFRKSRIGDEAMDRWAIEYEFISRKLQPKGTLRDTITFERNHWRRSLKYDRAVQMIGITRTVPPGDNPLFHLRNKLSIHGKLKHSHKSIEQVPVENIDHIKQEAETVLSRSFKNFQLFEVRYTFIRRSGGRHKIVDLREILDDGRVQTIWKTEQRPIVEKRVTASTRIYVGSTGDVTYSEFSFGSGEASVIHVISDIEALPDGSLVLLEEIENGLHPLAVCRLVDYLIAVSARKRLQILFTTHSDHALMPLPSEAIWATVDGRVEQGKLSIPTLRAVSGRIDRRLAIFVEDVFAETWLRAIIRERLGDAAPEIGVYPLHGDGNAVRIHRAHTENPAIPFKSLCFIDGDSNQFESKEQEIFRLPGGRPESTVFNDVAAHLEENIAILTVASHRPADKQAEVADAVRDVSRTNRDPHLLFSQLGIRLGFVAEATVAGAFLAVWIAQNPDKVDQIAELIREALGRKSNASVAVESG